MPRRFSRNDNWEYGGASAPATQPPAPRKPRKRRLATTFIFTTLFFAGASIAAIAGDQLSSYSSHLPADEAVASEPTDSTATQTMTDAAAPADVAPASAPQAEPAAPADPPASAPAATDAAATDTPVAAAAPADPAAAETTADPAAADGQDPTSEAALLADLSKPSKPRTNASAGKASRTRKPQARVIVVPKPKPAAPELEGPADGATIWLNSALPDPTPPALRLSPRFAQNLRTAAKESGVNWALMLGILRARGLDGQVPADRSVLRKLASGLASAGPTKGEWASVVSYSGDTAFADRAAALARYDRAVGLGALVKGLEAAKKSLVSRLLSDPLVSIYPGGRNDIVENKVDVRVLALIAYMRESFGQITVSCLISGHHLYARPGVISAHIPGRAVDISALDNTPIQGHQEPGGLTERAVRDILLLPSELVPQQVISLLGLGGPSFPLANHYNHIHVGY